MAPNIQEYLSLRRHKNKTRQTKRNMSAITQQIAAVLYYTKVKDIEEPINNDNYSKPKQKYRLGKVSKKTWKRPRKGGHDGWYVCVCGRGVKVGAGSCGGWGAV